MKKITSKVQFSWEGKEEALKECNAPPKIKYEVPQKVDGNEIHCVDNLDFLKNNLERLRGKVKCIYIDPPYNTGKDFIYKDKCHQKNECKHSKWLSFMYPRLVLARELLREDGVIFISIDDNEQANLKLLMDEVFGEGEFVACFVVNSAPAGTQSSVNIAQQHSYCLMFQKSSEFRSIKIIPSEEELNKKYYEKDETGYYYPERLWKRGIGGKKEDVPSLHFPVYYNSKTNEIFIDNEIEDIKDLIKIIPYQTKDVLGRWTWSKDKMKNEKYKLIVKLVNNEYKLHKKKYKHEDEGKLVYSIIDSSISRTELGSLEIKEIMEEKIFDYPKPVALIKHLLQISTTEGDLILDFFAGSGTTAQAVMELNQEEIDKQAKDGLLAEGKPAGGRKFILVQLPEKISEKQEAYKAGYRVISDITMERVRRAGVKYKGVDTSFKIFK